MKIIIQAPNGVSLHQFCLGLIQRLQHAGHDVVAAGKDDGYGERLRARGVTFCAIPIAEDSTNPVSLYRYMKSVWGLYREVRPDMIHLFSPRAAIFGTVVARMLGIPSVCTLTGLGHAFTLPLAHPIRVAFVILYRLVLPLSKAVIFLNPDDYALFRRLGLVSRYRSLLIRSSGVNVERYKRNGDYPTPTVFIFVGRLMRNKGIYYFLRAAASVARRFPDAHFVVAGGTNYGRRAVLRPEDMVWYKNLLGSRIEFSGHITDIRALFARASVLVLPSYYREGVPQSILEAMAYSLPIVTTDTPGCRETVTEGVNGYLVAPHSVAQLVERMQRFMLEPHLIPQMGARSRAMVVEHFSEKSVIERTLRCYIDYIKIIKKF